MMQQAQVHAKSKAESRQERERKQETQIMDSLAAYLAMPPEKRDSALIKNNVRWLLPDVEEKDWKKVDRARDALKCGADLAVCIEPKEGSKYSTIKKMFDMIAAAAGSELSKIMDDPIVQGLLILALKDNKGDFIYHSDGLLEVQDILVNEALREGRKADMMAIRAGRKPLEGPPSPKKEFVPAEMAEPGEEEILNHLGEVPDYVKDTTIEKLIEEFEKAPSDGKLELIAMRLQYRRDQRSLIDTSIKQEDKDKVAEIDAEIAKLQKWLIGLGLIKTGESVDKGITGMRAEFVAIQAFYYSMDEQKRLIYALNGASVNDNMFMIVKKYLSGLDNVGLKMFSDINPRDYQYVRKVEGRIDQFLAASDYKRAKNQWFTDYYTQFNPKDDSIGSPLSSAAYQAVADLNPVLAAKFAEYLKKVGESGLSSQQEKDEVVSTVIKLYALNPILVGKYFDAITHIADICEDNAAMYRDALAKVSARLSAEADGIVNAASPAQILPMNIRRVATNLGNALDAIAKIDKAALSSFNRLDLWDENVYRNPNPPHEIWQKAPGYIPDLNVNEPTPGTLGIPYPFANQQFPEIGPMMGQGSVGVNQTTYGGSLVLPNIVPLNISGGSLAQAMASHAYLWPEHPFISINKYLPGVNISQINPTELLMEIDKAFIPTAPPEYSGKIIGGGGAAGVAGQKPDEWQIGGGGLGTFITPTGGFAFGGYGSEQKVLAGATAIAIPLGRYTGEGQTMTPGGPVGSPEGMQWISGLDTAFAGYEEDLDEETKKLLMQIVQTSWNKDNPSQKLITLNWTEDKDGKQTLLTRYFYMEKDGTIYELTGGVNDFVHNLNFLGLYGNEPFKSNQPVTYAANVEPGMERGGFAMAIDIGKQDAVLAHFQEIPFWVSKDVSERELKAQPLLIQWTPGYAHSEGIEGEEGTRLHEIVLPGQMLRLKKEGDEDNPEGKVTDEYFLQDVVYKLREVRSEKDAWELTIGAGAGYAEKDIDTPEKQKEAMGRGGVFLKVEKPKSSGGFGLYYEGGQTRLAEIAMVSEAEASKEYIENLHRIGLTLYGSKEYADRLVLGALVQGVEQLKENKDSVEHDVLLGRLIGLFIGAESAGRIGFSRITGLDEMKTDYQRMGERIARDPSSASTEIEDFKRKYEDSLTNIYDKYSLGLNITKDFSMEFYLMSAEEKPDWVNQKPQNIYSRMLLTWNDEETGEGFWRIFASVPLGGNVTGGAAGASVTQNIGMVGTGFGQDLFDSLFFQRIAVDCGILAQRTDPAATASSVDNWKYDAGGFVQGELLAFSNMVQDSKRYRILENKFNELSKLVAEGKFDEIPEPIRKLMCDYLESAYIAEKIKEGKYSELSSEVNAVLAEDLRRHLITERLKGYKESERDKYAVAIGERKYDELPADLKKDIQKYDGYATSVINGRYDDIPKELKELIISFDSMAPKVSKEVIASIRNGKSLHDPLQRKADVNPTELTLIRDALYAGWFLDEKEKIQKVFDGHTRVYLGGSGYFLGEKTQWDIGIVAEYINGLTTARFYAIAAQRDQGFGMYAGADVTRKVADNVGLTAGAMVNVTDSSHGVAVSVGVTWDVEGIPWNLSALGYSRSQDLPEYTVPLYERTEQSGIPEFGVMLVLTIGLGTSVLPAISPAPGVQNSPYP